MKAQLEMKIDVKMDSEKNCMEIRKAIIAFVTEHNDSNGWRYKSKIILNGEVNMGHPIAPTKYNSKGFIIPDKEATRRAASILKEEISSKNVDEE